MVLRVLTDTNFFDVQAKGNIDKEVLCKALEDMSTLVVETKDNSTIFINTVNVVAIEVFDTPPISEEK